MSFAKVAQNLTKATYRRLRESLQLGKWPDGRPLSRAQQEICMEAIITYEAANKIPEIERVGYLNRDRPKPQISASELQDADDQVGNNKRAGNDKNDWSVIRTPDS